MAQPMIWIHDYLSPVDIYAHALSEVLEYRETAFQKAIIGETEFYGKLLVLDGKVQSSEVDEFLYHEPMVQPAMLQAAAVAPPKNVLVLGGGEGACLREALRWTSVERIVMVDVDGEVVDMCKRHLPTYHEGAFDDPRVELVITDAWDYVRDTTEKFDAVFSDMADPMEGGPARKLYTREYFQMIRSCMSEHGAFCMQAGPLAPPFLAYHARVHRTLAEAFPTVASLNSWICSFGLPWGFLLACNTPLSMAPVDVDSRIARHTTGGLRFLDGNSTWASLQMPPFVKDAIRNAGPAYTMDSLPSFGEAQFASES